MSALVDPGVVAGPAAGAPRLDVATQARLVGLKKFEAPTLAAVERRRWQLWLLSTVIILGATALAAIASLWPQQLRPLGINDAPNSIAGFRVLMLILTVVFAGYAAEKEVSLRRLTRMLVDERGLTIDLSHRLSEVSALLDAGKAINSVLDLPSVLDIILNSARSLVEAGGGSIMLVDHHGRGGLGPSGHEAEPLRSIRVIGNEVSVPLVHRDGVLGVLNITGIESRPFTEYDLRVLSVFAEQAAAAIVNARLYEIERLHVAELLQGEVRKSEFLAGVSHDLRTPLTALIGCTKILQREGLPAEHRVELAAMVDRQALRLKSMIEDLLAAARLEIETPPPLEPVDLVPLLSDLAAELRMVGKVIHLHLPEPGGALTVSGRADSLQRVFTNLVDNAFKHGEAPVSVLVTTSGAGIGATVQIDVSDRGPGIPEDDRERVFERFCRLDKNRNKPGIGLGLSIVHGLVTASGGTIRALAGPDGSGTVMRVRLQRA